jgi:hypothetical protein
MPTDGDVVEFTERGYVYVLTSEVGERICRSQETEWLQSRVGFCHNVWFAESETLARIDGGFLGGCSKILAKVVGHSLLNFIPLSRNADFFRFLQENLIIGSEAL